MVMRSPASFCARPQCSPAAVQSVSLLHTVPEPLKGSHKPTRFTVSGGCAKLKCSQRWLAPQSASLLHWPLHSPSKQKKPAQDWASGS